MTALSDLASIDRGADARRAQNDAARALSHDRTGSEEYDKGFHGDAYLLALMDEVLPSCASFVETGANLGNTAVYVAKRFPKLACATCEPGAAAFTVAARRAEPLPNLLVRETTSPEFFDQLVRERPAMLKGTTCFHLDAHGYGFYWPLWDEVSWITSRLDRAVVLIDDLLVPGRPWFKFDEHEGQVCSIEALLPRLAPGRKYRILYPTYQDRTSVWHPLVGHGLLSFGDARPRALGAAAGRYEEVVIDLR